jgi:ABC-2 type transport system ATP-binding protein
MRSLAESKTLVLSSHNLIEVQEVCSRVVLLHEGQVIFNGGLDELQKSLTPGVIDVTLAGDKRSIADAAKAIGELEEIEHSSLQRNVLRLRLRAGVNYSGVLANVLMTISDRKLETTDLRMTGTQAEQAILRCIQEEKSHGITRAHQPVGR